MFGEHIMTYSSLVTATSGRFSCFIYMNIASYTYQYRIIHYYSFRSDDISLSFVQTCYTDSPYPGVCVKTSFIDGVLIHVGGVLSYYYTQSAATVEVKADSPR